MLQAGIKNYCLLIINSVTKFYANFGTFLFKMQIKQVLNSDEIKYEQDQSYFNPKARWVKTALKSVQSVVCVQAKHSNIIKKVCPKHCPQNHQNNCPNNHK